MWRGTKGGRRTLLGLAVGLISGGFATAVLLWVISGLASWAPPAVAASVVVGAAIAAILRDFGVLPIPLPERRQLVPKSVLTQAPPSAALVFGFELGLGFRTYVSASAPYLLLLALLVYAGPLPIYLASGAAFGLGRLAMPVTRYFAINGEEWDELIQIRARLIRATSALAAAFGATLLFVT